MGPSRPQSSEALVRKGHLTGLKPVVLVIFQSPVNFNRWKLEQLQIQMEAAPFRSKGGPAACLEGWGISGASEGFMTWKGRLGASEDSMTWWKCGVCWGPSVTSVTWRREQGEASTGCMA